MYISIVEIDLPAETDCEVLKDAFMTTGPRYVDVPGLLRKYYTLQDGTMTGGVFVWDTLENAKAGHADPGWRKIIADRYGNEPRVAYYEVPTIVDNVMGAVLPDGEYLRACAKELELAKTRAVSLPTELQA